MRATSVGVVAALVLAGCVDRPISRLDPTGQGVEQKLLPVSLNQELDLLFVIDNSGSMEEEHRSLEDRFPELIAHLDELSGRLPDLHIGVVSSDMGTGNVDVGDNRCGPGGGDRGIMHGATCPALGGASFLTDVVGPTGDRVRNYTGTLDDAFACAANLGIGGCGFEQHLAAMQAALSPGVNPGFLREPATLAVIIVADEDDCSADVDRIFSRTEDAELGPFSDFRCYEQGVVCANDPDPRLPGPRAGCVPRPTSPFLVEIEQYAGFLRGLKRAPDHKLFVAGIIGDPANVRVVLQDNDPALDFGCSGALGFAEPAVRLAGFLDQFPGTSARETICTGDLGDALRAIVESLPPLEGVCFDGVVADRNPIVDGIQPECSVVEITDLDGPARRETPLPGCEGSTARPCWRITEDAATCAATDHHLRIDVERSVPAPANAYLEVQCVVSIPVPPPS